MLKSFTTNSDTPAHTPKTKVICLRQIETNRRDIQAYSTAEIKPNLVRVNMFNFTVPIHAMLEYIYYQLESLL